MSGRGVVSCRRELRRGRCIFTSVSILVPRSSLRAFDRASRVLSTSRHRHYHRRSRIFALAIRTPHAVRARRLSGLSCPFAILRTSVVSSSHEASNAFSPDLSAHNRRRRGLLRDPLVCTNAKEASAQQPAGVNNVEERRTSSTRTRAYCVKSRERAARGRGRPINLGGGGEFRRLTRLRYGRDLINIW